ncbi:hypothetical protein ALC60_04594 [Trachymyrmex zeteki]|uniref:Uncharacterized protein n=1 Tax=Mycetomoellerius zeteki TaxID=64791 RepID=A0A151X816_9HYME|nr:hypothetical protein ALC60_04594 [Trachymyrmex zeteki]
MTKRAIADLTSSKLAQDFQVEGGHWPSGLGIRKRLLLDPGGFPNLADPRTLLHGPLQKWLGRCMTRVSLCHVVPSKFKANDTRSNDSDRGIELTNARDTTTAGLDNFTKSVTCIRPNRSDDKERDGKARDVVEDERARLRRKREALEVAAITADKQLEISPKEEFSGNGAAGQKRGRAQRKLTAKGKKRNARAPTWPIEKKKSRLLAQRGERRETRSDGGRLREEKKNNKKENASSNSGRPTE